MQLATRFVRNVTLYWKTLAWINKIDLRRFIRNHYVDRNHLEITKLFLQITDIQMVFFLLCWQAYLTLKVYNGCIIS